MFVEQLQNILYLTIVDALMVFASRKSIVQFISFFMMFFIAIALLLEKEIYLLFVHIVFMFATLFMEVEE